MRSTYTPMTHELRPGLAFSESERVSPLSTLRRVAALVLATAVAVAACGGGNDEHEPGPRKLSGPLFDAVNVIIANGGPSPEAARRMVSEGLAGLSRDAGAAAVDGGIAIYGPYNDTKRLNSLPKPTTCNNQGTGEAYDDYMADLVAQTQAQEGFAHNPKRDLAVVMLELPTLCPRRPGPSSRAIPGEGIVFINSDGTPSAVAHEAGHVKRLSHSYFMNPDDIGRYRIYDVDTSSLMGTGTIGEPSPLTGLDLVRLGSLYPEDIVRATKPDVHLIERLDTAGKHPKVLQVRVPRHFKSEALKAAREFLGTDGLTAYVELSRNFDDTYSSKIYLTTTGEEVQDGLHDASVLLRPEDYGAAGFSIKMVYDEAIAVVTVLPELEEVL